MPLRLAKAEGSGKERDSFGFDFRVVGAIILPPWGPLPWPAPNELQGGVVQLSPLHSCHRAHSLIIPVFSLWETEGGVSGVATPALVPSDEEAAPSQMVSNCSVEAAEGANHREDASLLVCHCCNGDEAAMRQAMQGRSLGDTEAALPWGDVSVGQVLFFFTSYIHICIKLNTGVHKHV